MQATNETEDETGIVILLMSDRYSCQSPNTMIRFVFLLLVACGCAPYANGPVFKTEDAQKHLDLFLNLWK